MYIFLVVKGECFFFFFSLSFPPSCFSALASALVGVTSESETSVCNQTSGDDLAPSCSTFRCSTAAVVKVVV